MATVDAALSRPPRADVRRLLMRRPELGASAVVALAWVMLFLLAARGLHRGDERAGMAGMAGMPGMAGMAGMPGMSGSATPGAWSVVAGGLPLWVLMTVAMMGLASLAGIRHTGLNSLRWRRKRAMVEFSAAYLSVWTAFGVVALAATAIMPGVPGSAALGVVLAVAAAWQLSPFKRRWLRDCHRSVPLPPRGWRAEADALRFGLRNGLSFLGSCWCLMLVMAAAPGGHLLWTAALAGVVTTEKLLERPRRATRLAAVALGVAAEGAVAVALA